MSAPHPHPGQPALPWITVVIVNFNRCQDLREALASVERQDYPRIRTVVVDNASSDDSRAMMKAEFPEVELVELSENLGMAGYSVGFEQATSEFLFQMDNDSLMPDPGILAAVVQCFDQGSPKLAAVACRVEEADTSRGFEDEAIELLRGRDRRRGPIVTGGFHSGGVGLRKSAVSRVEAYHRSVFLYGSELFLEMKLLAEGWEIEYFPEILMLHKSSGAARSSQAVYFELRNRYWFMRRFGSLSEQLRFLPTMLFHDLFYALFKRQPGALLSAVRDGFGPLPADLRPALRSSEPSFRDRVREVGGWFGLGALSRRILRQVRP